MQRISNKAYRYISAVLKVPKSRHTVFLSLVSLVHALMVIFLCTIAFAIFQAAFRQGAGRGPVFLDHVRCNGTESSLLSCKQYIFFCSNTPDAGVVCSPRKL